MYRSQKAAIATFTIPITGTGKDASASHTVFAIQHPYGLATAGFMTSGMALRKALKTSEELGLRWGRWTLTHRIRTFPPPRSGPLSVSEQGGCSIRPTLRSGVQATTTILTSKR